MENVIGINMMSGGSSHGGSSLGWGSSHGKIDEQNALVKELRTKNAKLQQKNAQIEADLMSQLSALSNALHDQTAEYDIALKSKNALITKLEQQSLVINTQMKHLKSEVTSMQSRSDDLKHENYQLQHGIEETTHNSQTAMQKLEKNQNEVSARMMAYQLENKGLLSKLNQKTAENVTLSNKLTDLSRNKSKVEVKNAAALRQEKEGKKQLEEELEHMHKEVEEAQVAAEAIQGKFDEMLQVHNDEMNSVQTNSASDQTLLRDTIESMKQQAVFNKAQYKRELKEFTSSLEQNIAHLKTELMHVQSEKETNAERSSVELEREHDQNLLLTSKVEKLQVEIGTLQEDVNKRDVMKEEVDINLREVQAKYRAYKDETKEEIKKLENKITSVVKLERDKILEETMLSKSIIQELGEEAEMSRKSADNAVSSVTKLEQEINDMKKVAARNESEKKGLEMSIKMFQDQQKSYDNENYHTIEMSKKHIAEAIQLEQKKSLEMNNLSTSKIEQQREQIKVLQKSLHDMDNDKSQTLNELVEEEKTRDLRDEVNAQDIQALKSQLEITHCRINDALAEEEAKLIETTNRHNEEIDILHMASSKLQKEKYTAEQEFMKESKYRESYEAEMKEELDSLRDAKVRLEEDKCILEQDLINENKNRENYVADREEELELLRTANIKLEEDKSRMEQTFTNTKMRLEEETCVLEQDLINENKNRENCVAGREEELELLRNANIKLEEDKFRVEQVLADTKMKLEEEKHILEEDLINESKNHENNAAIREKELELLRNASIKLEEDKCRMEKILTEASRNRESHDAGMQKEVEDLKALISSQQTNEQATASQLEKELCSAKLRFEGECMKHSKSEKTKMEENEDLKYQLSILQNQLKDTVTSQLEEREKLSLDSETIIIKLKKEIDCLQKVKDDVEKQGALVVKQLQDTLNQCKLSDAEKDHTINGLAIQVDKTQDAFQEAKSSLESLRLSAENNENENKSFLDMAQAELQMAKSEKQMVERGLQNKIDLLEKERDGKYSSLKEALEAVSTKENELKIIQEQVFVIAEKATAKEMNYMNQITNLEKEDKTCAEEIRKLSMQIEEKNEAIASLQHKLLNIETASESEVCKYQEQIMKLNMISKKKESEVAKRICELEGLVEEYHHSEEIIALDNSKLNDRINEMETEVKETVELKEHLNEAQVALLMVEEEKSSMVHRHNDELELLQQELFESRQDKETVVDEHISGLRSEMEDVIKCLSEKEAAVNCLELKLHDCNETIEELQDNCSLHDQTKELLTSEVTKLRFRIKEEAIKQNELDELCREIERKSVQHADHVKELEKIKAGLKDRDKTITAMAKSSIELEKKVKSLEAEKEIIKNQLNSLVGAETSAANKQTSTLKQLEDRDKTINALTKSSVLQERKAVKLKAQKDNLDHQLSELQDSNEILDDLVEKLQMEKNEQEHQLAQTRNMEERYAKSNSHSLKESQKKVAFLEAELSNVHSSLTDLIEEKGLFESKVTEEKENLREEIEQKKAQISDLEVYVEELKNAGDKINTLTAKLNERSKAASSLSGKTRALEQKIVTLKSEIIALRKRKGSGASIHEYERLQRESEIFAGQVIEQDEEIESLTLTIESRDRECDALKKRQFTLEQKLKTKSGVHDDDAFAALRFEVQALQNENMLLERDKKILRKKMENHDIEEMTIHDLESRLEKFQVEAANLKRENTQLTRGSDAVFDQKVRKLVDKMTSNQAEMEEKLNMMVVDAEKEKEVLNVKHRDELRRRDASVAALEKNCIEKESKLEEHKELLRMERGHLNSLKQKMEESINEGDFAEIKMDNMNMKKEVDDLRKELQVKLIDTGRIAELRTKMIQESEGREKFEKNTFQTFERKLSALKTNKDAELSSLLRQCSDLKHNKGKIEVKFMNEIATLEAANNDIKAKFDHMFNEKDEIITSLEKKVEAHESVVDQMHAEMHQLQSNMEKVATSRRGEVEDINQELMDTTAKATRQERDISTLKMKLEERKLRQKEEMKKLQSTIDMLKFESPMMRDVQSAREGQMSDELNGMMNNLKLRNNALSEECTNLRAKLEKFDADAKNSSRNDKFRNSALKEQVKVLTKRVKELDSGRRKR